MTILEAVLNGVHHIRDDTPTAFTLSVIPNEPPPGETAWLEARLVLTYRLGDQVDSEGELYHVGDWRWHHVEVFAENCAHVAEIDATRVERTPPWPTPWGETAKTWHSFWAIFNELPPMDYRIWSYTKKSAHCKVLDFEFSDEDGGNIRQYRLTTSEAALARFARDVMDIRCAQYLLEERWQLTRPDEMEVEGDDAGHDDDPGLSTTRAGG